MARGKKITKRVIAPDPIYGSKLLAKFINRSMYDGKKSVAQSQVYGALKLIEETQKTDPLRVFEQAIANVAPRMEVRPRRIGGASYQIPVEVRGERKETLAIRWLIEATRARSNKEFHSYAEKLAAELKAAAENQGAAISKKENTLRAAEANKAFSHFRW